MDTADLDWLAAGFGHLPVQSLNLGFLGGDTDVEAAWTGCRFALPDRHQSQHQTVVRDEGRQGIVRPRTAEAEERA
jgi:hypothetical protein